MRALQILKPAGRPGKATDFLDLAAAREVWQIRASPCDRRLQQFPGRLCRCWVAVKDSWAEAMCLRLLPDSIVTTAKKVPISVLCHPLGTRQMGFPRPARPLRLAGRINMQHEARHLGPVRALGVGVQEA